MRKYPSEVRRKVRKLIRSGLSRTDVSRVIGICCPTIARWTSDMHAYSSKECLSGLTLKILKELATKGYVFPDISGTESSYKTLRKYLPVKRVKTHGMSVLVMKGSERKAAEAFLERRNFRSLSYGKLGQIRKAFGIKKMGRENKIGRI